MSNSSKRAKADVITPGLGEIDKVRDILFGKYVSDFEHRFADLESRLESDVEQLKVRLSKKFEGMDVAVNESLARLDNLINQEQSKRDAEIFPLCAGIDFRKPKGSHDRSKMMIASPIGTPKRET